MESLILKTELLKEKISNTRKDILIDELRKELLKLQLEFVKNYTSINVKAEKQKCFWTDMDPYKPAGLSCPCPRCTPYTMNVHKPLYSQ